LIENSFFLLFVVPVIRELDADHSQAIYKAELLCKMKYLWLHLEKDLHECQAFKWKPRKKNAKTKMAPRINTDS